MDVKIAGLGWKRDKTRRPGAMTARGKSDEWTRCGQAPRCNEWTQEPDGICRRLLFKTCGRYVLFVDLWTGDSLVVKGDRTIHIRFDNRQGLERQIQLPDRLKREKQQISNVRSTERPDLCYTSEGKGSYWIMEDRQPSQTPIWKHATGI